MIEQWIDIYGYEKHKGKDKRNKFDKIILLCQNIKKGNRLRLMPYGTAFGFDTANLDTHFYMAVGKTTNKK